jgi:hypothetical protein
MKTAVVLAASLVALSLSVSASTGSAGSTAACKPGEQTIGGAKVYVYCGPARATVRTGGRAFPISRGTCGWRPASRLYMVDVGVEMLDEGAAKTRYLGIRTPHKAGGTYQDVGIAIQVKGRKRSLGRSTVTIAKDLRHGTFSGDFLFGPGSARGSWSC